MKGIVLMKYDVFISYRHEMSWDDAYQLQKALADRGFKVFRDDHSIHDGNFEQKILKAIGEAPVFILMLAKGALDKCCSEDDWVRKEIEYAIRKGCYILPVLPTDQPPWTSPASLPENIRRVLEEQGAKLYKGDEQLFEASVDIIKERIWGSIRYLLARAHQAYQEQNYFEAAKFYQRCAERGDADAKCRLGRMCYEGEGCKQDRAEAYRLFKEAAEVKHPRAWLFLGQMQEESGDVEEAKIYYKEAERLGDKDAKVALARLMKMKRETDPLNRAVFFLKITLILLAIPGFLVCGAIFIIFLKLGLVSF